MRYPSLALILALIAAPAQAQLTGAPFQVASPPPPSAACGAGTYVSALNGSSPPTCGTPAGTTTGANPTATIGASAVNGSAATFMRSDAAPPLPATLPALNGSNLTALAGGNITAGSVANAALTNPSVTVGGATCTLGSTCAPSGAPYWSIYINSDSGTIASAILVPWNTKNFDPSTICDVVTTRLCTPNVAGTYSVTCSVYVGSTTGAALGNSLAVVQLVKNGTTFAEYFNVAQAATIVGDTAFATVSSLVQANGSSDTIGCKAQSDSTAPFVKGQQNRSFMTGFRIGAQ